MQIYYDRKNFRVPVEVKSGPSGSLGSLHLMLATYVKTFTA